MRLGLIGDVHAEDERLRVALGHLALRSGGVDRILCTGNVVDGPGDVDRACELLASHDVLTVRGNHDRWIREDAKRDLPHAHRMTSLASNSIAFLKTLEATASIETPRGTLMLCHGVGGNDMAPLNKDESSRSLAAQDDLFKVLLDTRVSILVAGHTRSPFVRRFERGSGQKPLWVVNAGTLARDDKPGFAVLDLAAAKVEFYTIRDSLEVEPASRAVI